MNLKPLSARTCFLLILLFGTAAYSNTLNSSFHFDDISAIVQNDSLHPLNAWKLWYSWPTRFIANLSFAFNLYLAGFQTWSFHILNLLIHILASLVVFKLTLSILTTPAMKDHVPASQQPLFALAAALFFATHPVQTEAVTYIVQRLTSLATLFYLATLLMYLKARLENARYYPAVFLFMLAAMFTKEISFTLPFAILLLEFFFFPISKEDPLGKKLLRWIPFAAFLLIIPLFCTIYKESFVRSGGAMNIVPSLDTQIPRWNYLLTEFRVMRTYLRLLLFPVNQCLDYDYRISAAWGDPDAWAAFGLLFSILILGLAFFKKNRLFTFGVLWFFLTLSVESSLIPISDVIYEHRLYLPMFGFTIFLTSLLWQCARSASRFLAFILLIAVLLSGMTYARNEVWKNPLTLWHDAIKKSPHKSRPYAWLGKAYAAERNDFKTAILYFKRALTTGPNIDPVEILSDMATAYSFLGMPKESAYYQKLVFSLTNPGDLFLRERFYSNQAGTLKSEKKIPEAIHALEKAIEIDPQDHFFHVQLGELYLETGREDAAIASFRKAIRLAPLSREGYDVLALFYTKKGEQQKAVDVMVEYLKFKKRHKPLFGS